MSKYGLKHKMCPVFPGNVCRLLGSYLSKREFQIKIGSAKSQFCPIHAGVPQGSVLGPTLYLLYTRDITTDDEDTAILAVSDRQEDARDKLQQALDITSKWFTDCKIKPNEGKSIYVTYIYRSV